MKTMSDLKVELWDIERVKPYPKNTKLHPDEQIERLSRTISRFGWDQPIVVDKHGVIIKGHGRRLAAIKLGVKQVPVWVRADLTQEEADAARIADNAVIGMQFDTGMMQEELRRLLEDGSSLNVDDLGLTAKDQQLLLDDLAVPSVDAIMGDTHETIEKQKNEDAERVAAVDKEEIPVAEALGFKKVTREQGRALTFLVANAESTTGKTGRDALMEYLAAVLPA
jgi:hypothetical protein